MESPTRLRVDFSNGPDQLVRLLPFDDLPVVFPDVGNQVFSRHHAHRHRVCNTTVANQNSNLVEFGCGYFQQFLQSLYLHGIAMDRVIKPG